LTEPVRVLPHALVPELSSVKQRLIRWRPKTGYTVILASIPLADGAAVARAFARDAIGAGIRRVGILDSSHFASLAPGYYAVFSGEYADADAARRALLRTARFFPAAYPREIVR
jgi:hypothetical protein